MIKNQKGITLIALVITIIVLLILAGVSIAMLTGPNGLLNNANTAKTETSEKGDAEKINIALQAIQTEIFSKEATTPSYDAKTDFAHLESAEVTGLKAEEYDVTDDSSKVITITSKTNSSIVGSIDVSTKTVTGAEAPED